MEKQEKVLTLSEVMEKLREKGYDHEFKYTSEGLIDSTGKKYQSQDLLILKTYHFDDDSNPDDIINLYIIKTPVGVIGYSPDTYKDDFSRQSVYSNFLIYIPKSKNEADAFDL